MRKFLRLLRVGVPRFCHDSQPDLQSLLRIARAFAMLLSFVWGLGGHADASAGVVHPQSLGLRSAKMRLAHRPALNPVIETGTVQRRDASYAHDLSDVG
jgi:hypothetical protein